MTSIASIGVNDIIQRYQDRIDPKPWTCDVHHQCPLVARQGPSITSKYIFFRGQGSSGSKTHVRFTGRYEALEKAVMPENARTYAAVHLILSLIAHVALIGPAVYIIILAAGLQYSLFLWHPTCMVVGVGLLMAEAVFGISGDALITSRVSRGGRIQLHYIMQVLGLILLIVGFATVVANKNINNANHFTSTHGKMGLASFIIGLVVAIGGIFMVRNSQLSGRTAIMKIIHACLGTIAMILLFVALILGFYRTWRPYSDLGRGLVVAAYIIGAVLVLARPLWGSLHRIRAMLF